MGLRGFCAVGNVIEPSAQERVVSKIASRVSFPDPSQNINVVGVVDESNGLANISRKEGQWYAKEDGEPEVGGWEEEIIVAKCFGFV
jgi:hypothetical protein